MIFKAFKTKVLYETDLTITEDSNTGAAAKVHVDNYVFEETPEPCGEGFESPLKYSESLFELRKEKIKGINIEREELSDPT